MIHGRAIAACAGGSAAPWTPYLLPDRILHLDAGAGVSPSSGSVTSWVDQSPTPKTVTITGTPTRDAAYVNLGGNPAVLMNSPDRIHAAVNHSTIAFGAAVTYVSGVGVQVTWDGDIAGATRLTVYTDSGVKSVVNNVTQSVASLIYTVAGVRRLLIPYDGVTAAIVDGVTRGIPALNVSTGTGMVFGSNYVPGGWSTAIAELIFCSSVPSLANRTALADYWAAKYP